MADAEPEHHITTWALEKSAESLRAKKEALTRVVELDALLHERVHVRCLNLLVTLRAVPARVGPAKVVLPDAERAAVRREKKSGDELDADLWCGGLTARWMTMLGLAPAAGARAWAPATVAAMTLRRIMAGCAYNVLPCG